MKVVENATKKDLELTKAIAFFSKSNEEGERSEALKTYRGACSNIEYWEKALKKAKRDAIILEKRSFIFFILNVAIGVTLSVLLIVSGALKLDDGLVFLFGVFGNILIDIFMVIALPVLYGGFSLYMIKEKNRNTKKRIQEAEAALKKAEAEKSYSWTLAEESTKRINELEVIEGCADLGIALR